MKVSRARTKDVVSYTISSGRNWLFLLIQCGLVVAAAILLRLQRSLWISVTLIILALLLRCEVSESVLAISGLGIQLEKKGRVMFWSDESRFFPKHSILAVLINEVFEGFRVNYVLQIVVADANEMSLVFPQFRPRLAVIEEVWQNIRTL